MPFLEFEIVQIVIGRLGKSIFEVNIFLNVAFYFLVAH